MEQMILVYGMLLHPNTSHILLVPSADGWTLPHFSRERWMLWSCTTDVNEAIRHQLGIAPVTLRCHAIDTRDADIWLVYGIENTDPSWTPPPDCRWVSCDEMLTAPLLNPRLTALVMSWFAWEEHTDPRRVPWYRRGWSRPATAWIAQQVATLGVQLTSPIQQLRTWQRSTVWKISTTDGPLFFKAVPAFFSYEIPLTEYLAVLFPDAMPRILATDYSHGWMLMANAGDHTLGQSSDLTLWSTALHRYAEMQVELSRHEEYLTRLGCPVIAPSELGDVLLKMAGDIDALTPDDTQFHLSVNERHALMELYQRISAVCQHLNRSPIPLSVDHGDLWSAQIMQCEKHPVFIDWSDANVTMPFVSVFKYLMNEEAGKVFTDTPDAKRTLRDAYLDPWMSFASHDQLEELYQHAQAIAALHYAAFDYRHLAPQMEVRWENENMVPFFLKRLIGVI